MLDVDELERTDIRWTLDSKQCGVLCLAYEPSEKTL